MPEKELLQAKTLVYCSDKQKALFERLTQCGTLTFVGGGPIGINVHMMGNFSIRTYDGYGPEFRLDLEDGTSHVHFDWSRIKRCQFSRWENEGEAAFFDGSELLFKIFRLTGPFPDDVLAFQGDLIDD